MSETNCPHLRVNAEHEATGGFILELGDRCLDCNKLVNQPSRDSRAEVIAKLERLIATFERRAQDSTLSSSTDCWNTAADDARTLLPLLRKDGR